MPSIRLSLASLAILLCAFEPSQSQAGEQKSPPKQEKPTPQTDPATIAKLVKQLGSKSFKERQQASTLLEVIGLPALDALRNATKGADLEFVRRATYLVSIIEDSLEQVLVDYRRYGLPLPPDDAKLVRFETGGRYVANGETSPPTHFFGFLLRAETKDKPALLLVGTREVHLAKGEAVEIVEPRPEIVRKAELRWNEWMLPYHLNAGLALALQCKARGWHELAQEFWTASRFSNSSNRRNLAYLVEAHCKNELVNAESDRTKTVKRLKALVAAEPELNAKENQALLKSLEAALMPSTAKAGTVERMIDDLTEMCRSKIGHKPDPRYTRLARLGFAAVPDLIEHLNDDRLTRSIDHLALYGNGYRSIPILRVKDVVGDLLYELSGREVCRGSQQAAAKTWWEKARKDGEEGYFLKCVLGNDEKEDWPNLPMLNIITEKYPRQLPKLYKIALDQRPKMQSWAVADAVAKSSLPDETKLKLLRHAANHKNLEHRRFALRHLRKLDPQLFMKLLLAALEAIPKTPAKAYSDCGEKYYANLVMAADDPGAWKTLGKVAKRSDVGLRMEFLKQVGQHGEEGQAQQRLGFLAAFLDDTELRDVNANPKMFDGIYAGAWIPRLEVRNLAAMQIASILKMAAEPDEKWTPQQWEKLRKKVRKALKR